MSKSTVRYAFEWKIFNWAHGFSRALTGRDTAFLMIFHPGGRADTVVFRKEGMDLHKTKDELVEQPYIFYDPFEAPVNVWLEWQRIEWATMERLVGTGFVPSDFRPERGAGGEPLAEFPPGWGVMY